MRAKYKSRRFNMVDFLTFTEVTIWQLPGLYMQVVLGLKKEDFLYVRSPLFYFGTSFRIDVVVV